MVFNVLGPSLLWFVRALQHRGLPREDVRCIARDVLQGLVLLHKQCKMVHTDLKLENILLSHGVSPLDVPATADDVLLKEGALLRGWAAGNGEHQAQRGSVPAMWMLLAASMQCNEQASSDSDEGVVSEAPDVSAATAAAGAVVMLPSTAAEAASDQEPLLSLPLQLTAVSAAHFRSLDESLSCLPTLPTSPGSQGSATPEEGATLESSWLPSATPTCFVFGTHTPGDTGYAAVVARLVRVSGPPHTIALRRTGPAPASAAAATSEGSQPTPNSQIHQVHPWILHVYNKEGCLPVLGAIEGSCDHFLWVVHSAKDTHGNFQPSLRGLVCRKAAFLRVAGDALPYIPSAPLFGKRTKLSAGVYLSGATCETGSTMLPRPLEYRCWLAGLSTSDQHAAAQEAASAAFLQAASAVGHFCNMWPAQHRITCAVVDLGNACDVANPYSEDIQTRQYRAPEVLIRAGFDTAADMWSMGCILFELITGDFLFNPRGGADFTCDEDHLAQMIELLGEMPKALRRKGADAKLFFNGAGKLKNIKKLKFWPVKLVLQDKYGLGAQEAACMADFLEGLLALQPEHRCSAQAALQHPWLQPHLSHDEAVAEFASSVSAGGGAAAAARSAALPGDAVAAAAPQAGTAAEKQPHTASPPKPPSHT